jgi:hypothetical protein
MTTPVLLDQLGVFRVDFNIWSATTKLEDPDVKLGTGGALPPKELAKLGSKYLIDKEHLRPFYRLKTEVRRLCLAMGMPFLNGFAVPVAKIDTLMVDLERVDKEFDSLKTSFLRDYSGYIDEWVSKNPEYEAAIRGAALSKSKVANRFGFSYQVFKIQPFGEAQSQKMEGMARGLADDLMAEIVDEANSFFHSALSGKDHCQTNTKKTLARLRDKVEGLTFLDGTFLAVVDLLNQAIDGYPVGGKVLVGRDFYRVLSVALILSSQDRIREYRDGKLCLKSMTDKQHFGSLSASQSTPREEQIDSNDEPDTTAEVSSTSVAALLSAEEMFF